MSIFSGYYSPIEQSVKPKSWFQETRGLMNSRLMKSPVAVKGPEYLPIPEAEEADKTSHMSELWNILPWAITLFVVVWNLIF